MRKIFKYSFIVLAILAMLEYFFICGMFTGPIMMALVFIDGIVNVILSVKEKAYNEAVLYGIAAIAICLGYVKLM